MTILNKVHRSILKKFSRFVSVRKTLGGRWEFRLDRWGCNCYYRGCGCTWHLNGTWIQVDRFTRTPHRHSQRIWAQEDYTLTLPVPHEATGYRG